MSNAMYDKGRDAFANKLIDWVNDDIRVALLSSGYTPNLSTHQYVSDLGANIVARSASSISGKSTLAGVCDATNHVIASVSGSQITRIALYQYNASDSAARLIGLIDSAAYGLPYTPDGTNITIIWDDGANKIFKL